MILVGCEQGSPEWHRARAGVITASMFRTARTKVGCLDERQSQFVALRLAGTPEKAAAEAAGYKTLPRSDIITRALNGEKVGDYSDAAKDYAFRLAIERISGEPLDEGFETWSMRRGHDLEPKARMMHELKTGLFVQRVGFMKTDDGLFGVSVDGLIDDDMGSEYKCFIDPGKLRSILMEGDISEVHDQSLGGMWITGRRLWHNCLFCPALESVGKSFWYQEFERDETFIEDLEKDMWEFSRLVEKYEHRLRAAA